MHLELLVKEVFRDPFPLTSESYINGVNFINIKNKKLFEKIFVFDIIFHFFINFYHEGPELSSAFY